MKRFFIDSNIFLRAIVKEDEKVYRECFDFLNRVEAGSIRAVSSNVVFAEVVWVLDSFYEMKKADIIRALQGMKSIKSLKLFDVFDFDLTLSDYSKFGVKYIDALIASIPEIQSRKMIVISYDRDFDKLGVARKEPSDILKSL